MTATTAAGPGGPPPAPSLITPELLAAFRVGEVSGRYTFIVTREHIKRFAGVLAHRTQEEQVVFDGDPGDGPPLAAPTVFFAALDPLELRIMSHDHGLNLIPFRKTGGGNAFNAIEYARPLLSGDVVTVAVTYTDIYEREGRSGKLLFRVRENTLTDRHGERIGLARSGHAYAFEVPGYQPPARAGRAGAPEPTGPEGGEELPPLVRTPTIETLVRYAAAADDFAPLHFDHNYALSRGYDGVIVHGFLKAGYMASMVEAWAGPGAFVKRFRAEYRGADYPGRPITCRGRVTRRHEEDGRPAADVDLRTERADGSVSTHGSATVLFPG